MASKFTKDHLSEFLLVFFRYLFRHAYGLSCAIFTHHLLLRSTGFSGPRERVPKNAFPLKQNAYFLAFPLRSLCVPFAFLERSLSVPGTRSLLGYFCPVLYNNRIKIFGQKLFNVEGCWL